jgi:hypothetical protein
VAEDARPALLGAQDRQCLEQAAEELTIESQAALQEICMAETKKDALAAFDAFVETWGVKYDKAVVPDRDTLLAFYDIPAEHRKHLRSTNAFESSFATVRHRTVRTKCSLSPTTAKLRGCEFIDFRRFRHESIKHLRPLESRKVE